MRPIDRSEILSIGEYEPIRERFRARVIAEKRPRRVKLGEHLSAVLENRDSVMLQIQEMLRTERITNEPGIKHEIDTYNDLIPGPDELSITLFVEIPEKELRERMLVELAGLEGHVGVEVDGARYAAAATKREGTDEEAEGAYAGRTTAVHYLKVKLPAEAADRLRARAAKAAVVVNHPRYETRAELGQESLGKLAEDLAS